MTPVGPEAKARREAERAYYRAQPSVYCDCGAEWHGRFTLNNVVMLDHEHRGYPCRVIKHEPACECQRCVSGRR